MSGANVSQLAAREAQQRLAREDLLSIHTREEEVTITSLGGTVKLKSLTARQRRELRDKAGWGTDNWDEELFTAYCVVACIVEPDITEADVEQLMEQDAAVWDEITLHVNLINLPSGRMTIKDLGKDSSPTES